MVLIKYFYIHLHKNIIEMNTRYDIIELYYLNATNLQTHRAIKFDTLKYYGFRVHNKVVVSVDMLWWITSDGASIPCSSQTSEDLDPGSTT